MVVTRYAFTLLELIVTIVVLGFIAAALPTLMIADQKSRDFSLIQEAIYASSAKMSQILSYKWDEASNENNNTVSSAKVLDVLTGDAALSRLAGTKFRVGHFQQTGRRSFHNADTNASLGPDGDMDDIDDAVTIVGQQLLDGATSTHGYKDIYTINVNVDFIADQANYAQTTINGFEFENNITAVIPSNIKRIAVTIVDSNGDTLFNLTTYSSNIGESSVFSRVYN